MATYRAIAASETDADSPVTATLMDALANNPTALAEGASGAPKIARKVVSGNVTAGSIAFTSLGDFAGLLAHGQLYVGGSTPSLTVEASDDGVSYGTASTLLSSLAIGEGSFAFFLDFDSGAFEFVYQHATTTGRVTGTLSGASLSTTAIRFTIGGGGQVSILAEPNGGASTT